MNENCEWCGEREAAPAPGVTEHDDGTLSWSHPTRGEIRVRPLDGLGLGEEADDEER